MTALTLCSEPSPFTATRETTSHNTLPVFAVGWGTQISSWMQCTLNLVILQNAKLPRSRTCCKAKKLATGLFSLLQLLPQLMPTHNILNGNNTLHILEAKYKCITKNITILICLFGPLQDEGLSQWPPAAPVLCCLSPSFVSEFAYHIYSHNDHTPAVIRQNSTFLNFPRHELAATVCRICTKFSQWW